MNKKLIITEEEKKQIKSLYRLNEIDAESIVNSLFKSAQDIAKQAEQGKLSDNSDNTEDSNSENTTDYSSSTDSGSGTSSDFIEITKKVIQKFEGGYWNPECAKYPGTKHPRKEGAYSRSGETMFGIDREAGDIEKAVPTEGKQFFGIIDQEKQRMGMENFCKKWKWNYGGGELRENLLDLAARIMKNLYDKNANAFFKGDTKKVVESSRPLMLHFSYGSWNGPGFFKHFAERINQGVKDGLPIRKLVKIAKEDRTKRFAGTFWAKGTEKVNAAIDDEAGYSA
jgi:hypothetical protein